MMLPLKDIIDKYGVKVTGILHCGANEGQEAEEYSKWGVERVMWIEAIPEVYAKLKSHVSKFPNQLAIKACLSNVDNEEVEFNISNNQSQSSSILQLGEHLRIHPEVHYVDKIKCTTVTIDTLFRGIEIDYSMIDFLNLDLQGAELMALQGATNFLKQINAINTEVNKIEVYKDCALIEDLDYFLLQQGFERVETGEWVGGGWSDAFYRRIYDAR
jgi:FkbM family methyltransferase